MISLILLVIPLIFLVGCTDDYYLSTNINIINNSNGTGNITAGSNGEIQFNDAGSFGADSDLTWDNANKRLGIGTNNPNSTIHIIGNMTITEHTIIDELIICDNGTATIMTRNTTLAIHAGCTL